MTTKNFTISLTLVLLIVFGYYVYANNLKTNITTEQTATTVDDTQPKANNLSVQTTYVLPAGEQTYNVSHGEEVAGPKMSQIVYSPLAFESGQDQKIKIVFPENEVVGSVVLFVNTDNKENQKVTLKKESKTNTWVGDWTPEDSIKTRYSVKIVAVGTAGEYNNTMYFL